MYYIGIDIGGTNLKAGLVDENYQISLVGSKAEKYLWILSRTPEVSDKVMDQVLEEASGRGYDIDNLIWVDQSANIEAR